MDKKIHALNLELAKLGPLISSCPTQSGKAVYRKKATALLEQRKKFTSTRDQLMQQSFNMEQALMMKGNLENTMITIDAMKTTTKELQRQYGKVKIEDIEKIQDQMEDMRDLGDEIQAAMSWSYDVPEDIDDAELDAELDMLETTMQLEKESGVGVGGAETGENADAIPDYLMDVPMPPTKEQPGREAATDGGLVKEAAR